MPYGAEDPEFLQVGDEVMVVSVAVDPKEILAEGEVTRTRHGDGPILIEVDGVEIENSPGRAFYRRVDR